MIQYSQYHQIYLYQIYVFVEFLSSVVSNAYLLFFANSNSLFVINEYIANNNAVKEISKAKKLDL